MVLSLKLSRELERRQPRAKGQARFQHEQQTIDHILTLWAIIEEVHHRSLKVSCCFVDFQKALDYVSCEALFNRLRDIGISDTLPTAIMHLYK